MSEIRLQYPRLVTQLQSDSPGAGGSDDAIASGGGGSHVPSMEAPSPTEIEAQIAASEARASTRLAETIGEMRTGFADLRGEMRTGFAEMRGEIGKLNERVAGVERTTAGIKTTIIATVLPTGIAIVAAIVGILTYGQAWFGIGVSTRDVIRATVAEMVTNQTVPPALQPPPKPVQAQPQTVPAPKP